MHQRALPKKRRPSVRGAVRKPIPATISPVPSVRHAPYVAVLDLWREAANQVPDRYAVLNTKEAIVKSLRQRICRGDHLAYVQLLWQQAEDGSPAGLCHLINHAVHASRAVLDLWDSRPYGRPAFDEERSKRENRRRVILDLACSRDDFPAFHSWKKMDLDRQREFQRALRLADRSIWKTTTMPQNLLNLLITEVLFPILEGERRKRLERLSMGVSRLPFENQAWAGFNAKWAKLPPLCYATRGQWARMIAEWLVLNDEQGGKLCVPDSCFPGPEIFDVGRVFWPDQSGLVLGPAPTFGVLIKALDKEFKKAKGRRELRLKRYRKTFQLKNADDRGRYEYRAAAWQTKIDKMHPSRAARVSSLQQRFGKQLASILKK